MTPHDEIRIEKVFAESNYITITVVPFDGSDPFDKTYSNNVDEALSEILGWETSSFVYY